MENSSGKFIHLSRLRKSGAREQVAAVCYRVKSGKIELLLVRTRSGKRWTFPKGGVERGLTPAQAAALEAFEEAGVHGRIEERAFAHYRRLGRNGAARRSSAQVIVQAHLCEVFRLSAPKESGRERTWFAPDVAKQCLCAGRNAKEASEFLRIVEHAVERVEQSSSLSAQRHASWDWAGKISRTRAIRSIPTIPRGAGDALLRVKFDFAEAGRSSEGASRRDHWRRAEQDGSRQVRRREIMPCEIVDLEIEGKLKLPN